MGCLRFATVVALVFAWAVSIPFVAGCSREQVSVIDKSRALEIAKAEAVRLGYDPGHMEAYADEANSRWLEFVKPGDVSKAYPELATKLEGKKYWAIYFGPQPEPGVLTFGGDLWVFVSIHDGDVLGVVRGK